MGIKLWRLFLLCLDDYTALFSNFVSWLVLDQLEDIAAWNNLPQVINDRYAIRILILHFSQVVGLEMLPWSKPPPCLSSYISMFEKKFPWAQFSNLMSQLCCRPTRELFLVTEWWLLGEPPPWTNSMKGMFLPMILA